MATDNTRNNIYKCREHWIHVIFSLHYAIYERGGLYNMAWHRRIDNLSPAVDDVPPRLGVAAGRNVDSVLAPQLDEVLATDQVLLLVLVCVL